jgi:hypothetical protein
VSQEYLARTETLFSLCHQSTCLNRNTLLLCVTKYITWIEALSLIAPLQYVAWTEALCFIVSPQFLPQLKITALSHHHSTLRELKRTDLLRQLSTLPGLKYYSQIILKWLNWGSQVLFPFCYQGGQIYDNELAWACSTHGRVAEKRSAHNSVVMNLKDRDHVGNIGLDGMVVFKWILSNLSWRYELDSPGLGSSQVAGSCEHENELRD